MRLVILKRAHKDARGRDDLAVNYEDAATADYVVRIGDGDDVEVLKDRDGDLDLKVIS